MKKLLSVVLTMALLVTAAGAFAAEAWTVTCPWAPSGVAAMVNQKAAALSTTYSNDIILVADAIKGDAATVNSWIAGTEANDPELVFCNEGLFSITSILDPDRLQFTQEDFIYIDNLYSSIFVLSADAKLGFTKLADLKDYLVAGNSITVACNGATGSEAFLAASLVGAMGYGPQLSIVAYESAAEAAQAVSRGETNLAISHQSQILETAQQGGVNVIAAFDGQAIQYGPFKDVEGVGQSGYPYFRNRCFIMARAGTDADKIEALKKLYKDILTDGEMVSWINDTMLLEADLLTEEQFNEHLENVRGIVNEYYDLVAN